MSIHDGHRERMKKRFKEHGLDNFDDHNALELLLFYALPRVDVNPIAHALIDRFKTLNGVFEASLDELCSVKGVGENTALFLKVIPQVSRRYCIRSAENETVLLTSKAAGKFLIPYFMYETREVIRLVCLDARGRVISCDKMGEGVVNSTDVNVRRIVETALERHASHAIIAHNHPDGIALPSDDDRSTTGSIQKALRLVGISLRDHIIVAGDDFVSLADSRMMY